MLRPACLTESSCIACWIKSIAHPSHTAFALVSLDTLACTHVRLRSTLCMMIGRLGTASSEFTPHHMRNKACYSVPLLPRQMLNRYLFQCISAKIRRAICVVPRDGMVPQLLNQRSAKGVVVNQPGVLLKLLGSQYNSFLLNARRA